MAIGSLLKLLTRREFRYLNGMIPGWAQLDFDGIVAGLEGQRQGKIANKRRKSIAGSQRAEFVENPPVIRF
jgi:sRNA-binding protein